MLSDAELEFCGGRGGGKKLRRAVLASLMLCLGCSSSEGVRFLLAPTFPVGSTPKALAVADFNGDQKSDLAVLDSDGVTLLLNQTP